MFEFQSETQRINRIIDEGARSRLTDTEFLEREIQKWKQSKKRTAMKIGENYYEGNHDILRRERTVIGVDGEVETIHNLPNNRIVDNQYGKLVDQKKNYLLGQPIVFNTEKKAYADALKQVFGKKFQRLIKNVGEDALNCGIGWLMPLYDQDGKFNFKRFKPYEIMPFWRDAEHTELDAAIRLYEVSAYEGKEEKIVEKVEVFEQSGIYRFYLDDGVLKPDDVPFENYFMIINSIDGNSIDISGWNWSKIPLIPWKYNAREIPLIGKVKSLQDGINTILSNFQNNMEEDARNTILVLVNYDGEDLGEFRRNLATYGAVKVRSDSSTGGGSVQTLQVEVNAENYKSIISILKKAMIENAKGFDSKDERLTGQPNQMNILSMYSDIDLDANEMETEFQASLEDMLWFVDMHLANTGQGDFENEEVEVIFNRDIMISVSEAITNIRDSVGILSDETLVAQHPWVDDPQAEMERIRLQREEQDQRNQYNPFASSLNQLPDEEVEEDE